jgi:hypothetical protein
VPSLQVAYVWHASVFTREVLDGLQRIGFPYPQQIIWNKGRTVLTRTQYWYQHEPCWYVRIDYFGRSKFIFSSLMVSVIVLSRVHLGHSFASASRLREAAPSGSVIISIHFGSDEASAS